MAKYRTSLYLDGVPTHTSTEQQETEQSVLSIFKSFIDLQLKEDEVSIKRADHIAFLSKALEGLPEKLVSLDASRPWLSFWSLHALELLGGLGDKERKELRPRVSAFLKTCQTATGGFGGGPGQLPHLAPTYASIASLLIVGGEEALSVVDRGALYAFLLRQRDGETGGFRMHEDGELDMRGAYCAIASASMCQILTPQLTEGLVEYVKSCQTWEGGIAGEPGLEAHGGYSYCGLAALSIIGKAQELELVRLIDWLVHRQMGLEGGFCGRTNKLVDSCYSFWQGAAFPLVKEALRIKKIQREGKAVGEAETETVGEFLCSQLETVLLERDLFSPYRLQMYVFLCCQETEANKGGLRDKPSAKCDLYHSCYSLSGLSVAQHGHPLQQGGWEGGEGEGGECFRGARAEQDKAEDVESVGRDGGNASADQHEPGGKNASEKEKNGSFQKGADNSQCSSSSSSASSAAVARGEDSRSNSKQRKGGGGKGGVQSNSKWPFVFGSPQNLLEPTCFFYNVSPMRAQEAREYFSSLPPLPLSVSQQQDGSPSSSVPLAPSPPSVEGGQSIPSTGIQLAGAVDIGVGEGSRELGGEEGAGVTQFVDWQRELLDRARFS
uniref:Protein farnesyltransferase subunit beta n=1 Tax=Chromera velia CCMP2878 TaxID=1169474 RepID=A0A0G4I558_9ALVE|eukprot:Cvel_11098.t1-p1 / transcript=Cvel_11098.t1 / gene=Cvel_11098 / organism=Chromera_velia_CCMP2878 / gene_product=Protein farnesyltransferase subunit beta, putative / transcript_product=Protein farnesyltransferase subunit beta, putative / location=Cvel_scaffold687:18592-20415(+) / protein_length=608 / sequence_SO=supercontig / SO=protein_coding / is_pseudo=false